MVNRQIMRGKAREKEIDNAALIHKVDQKRVRACKQAREGVLRGQQERHERK